jgi:hypothetical protein
MQRILNRKINKIDKIVRCSNSFLFIPRLFIDVVHKSNSIRSDDTELESVWKEAFEENLKGPSCGIEENREKFKEQSVSQPRFELGVFRIEAGLLYRLRKLARFRNSLNGRFA